MRQTKAHVLKSAKGTRTIPSLDGLRAVSIALVILAHAKGTRGFPAWVPQSVTDHGVLGVHILFVISGFLITTLLIEEQGATGTISLGLFYARRSLRIFPPYYSFLAVVAFGAWMGVFNLSPMNFLFAATYTTN